MIIAITGSMGAGKTTATNVFPLSWKRISADTIGHALLLDPHIMKRLTTTFGNKIMTKRKINRALLAQCAFSNKKNLKKLNAIIHPALRKKIMQEIKKIKKSNKHVVLDCALLYELRLQNLADFIILVTVPERICLARTTKWNKRDITTRAQFQHTVQNPDFIIANTGPKSALKKAVQKIVTCLENS